MAFEGSYNGLEDLGRCKFLRRPVTFSKGKVDTIFRDLFTKSSRFCINSRWVVGASSKILLRA